jgi:hypothetical protein
VTLGDYSLAFHRQRKCALRAGYVGVASLLHSLTSPTVTQKEDNKRALQKRYAVLTGKGVLMLYESEKILAGGAEEVSLQECTLLRILGIYFMPNSTTAPSAVSLVLTCAF